MPDDIWFLRIKSRSYSQRRRMHQLDLVHSHASSELKLARISTCCVFRCSELVNHITHPFIQTPWQTQMHDETCSIGGSAGNRFVSQTASGCGHWFLHGIRNNNAGIVHFFSELPERWLQRTRRHLHVALFTLTR